MALSVAVGWCGCRCLRSAACGGAGRWDAAQVRSSVGQWREGGLFSVGLWRGEERSFAEGCAFVKRMAGYGSGGGCCASCCCSVLKGAKAAVVGGAAVEGAVVGGAVVGGAAVGVCSNCLNSRSSGWCSDCCSMEQEGAWVWPVDAFVGVVAKVRICPELVAKVLLLARCCTVRAAA